METVSYGEFSQTFHARTMERHLPLSGTIEVTRRCPLTCVHCYNNLPMADHEAARTELSYEEHCRILDELADAGCLWLLFTGGEIFARRDFLDIYTYAKTKGFLITLFTNGTLITPRIADYLAMWRPFAIEITLYGRTRETYERLTGVPGSYDKCLRGIHLLLERKLPLALKSVAVSVNVHELHDMQAFADELGVRVQVRRDDESTHRLLAEPARGPADARGLRGARSRGSAAGRRVEAHRQGVPRAPPILPTAPTRSITAAEASLHLRSTRKGASASACSLRSTSSACEPDRCATAGTARCARCAREKSGPPPNARCAS